ncbi:MAG: hypothetical protein DHS20C21_00560 [Gemmatimonadota bacterium]|nr:MAG: hypothetical protein DHS20C21_00560 [Gemmatimonadota bacterium]
MGCEEEQGQWGTVEWAKDHRGRMPAREFFVGLGPEDVAKVSALFRKLANTGKIRNREKFKKVDSIWEFKSFRIRLLGDFRPGHRFVVALGVIKKKGRLRQEDLDKAVRILEENDARETGK